MRVRPRALFAVVSFMLTLSAHTVAAPPALLTDGNPQNPANWEALPTLYSGSDHLTRSEYETVNGQQTVVQANYLRDWTENQWYRNGVAQPGLNLNEPWHKQVSELDLLSASSTGSVTIRLHWISAEAAPDSVRVRVHSIARAMVGPTGTFTANNGLNSPTNQTNDGDWFSLLCNAPELRTLKVTNGIAEIVLQKSATASMACAAGSHLGDVVFAGAKGGYCDVDNRYVFILLNGQQYTWEPTSPDTVAIKRWKNLHHDVVVPEADDHFTYQRAARVPVKVKFDTAESNFAEYVVSVPTSKQDLTGNEEYESFIHQYRYLGLASTENLAPESYEWSSGLGGTLPNTNGAWLIEDLLQSRPYHYLFNRFEYASTTATADWHPQPTTTEEVSLTYKWSDGVFGISRRSVTFRSPREDISVSEPSWSDQYDPQTQSLASVAVRFPQFDNTVVPAGISHTQVEFVAGWFDSQTLIDITGILAAAAGVTAWRPEISVPLGVAAGLSQTLVLVNSATAPAPQEIGRDFDANFTWWVDGGEQWTAPPVGWNIDAWLWRITLRPQVETRVIAYDMYNMNGFVGRFLDTRHQEEKPQTARRLYWFFRHASDVLPLQAPQSFGG